MKDSLLTRILLKNSHRSKVALCALAATALMLTVIQPPISVSLLAWVSLVPFIIVCYQSENPWRLILAAYAVSFLYWLGNLYWVAPVTVAGWIAFCLYIALLWPMLAICLRHCRKLKIPLFIVVPILFVGAERLQGLFLGGFYWRFLAHSQYANIRLIQIADIFGAAGVSFLIAMVNGSIAGLIISFKEKRFGRVGNSTGVLVTICVLAWVLAFGHVSLVETEKVVRPGPLIASVQSNVPLAVKESGQASEQILEDILKESSEAADVGARLIVWPETMVQAVLSESVLSLIDPNHKYNLFDNIIRTHAGGRAFILAGSHGAKAEVSEYGTVELPEKYNSAFLYRPDGNKDAKQYAKIHLVPFGEFIPFKKSWPAMYRFLMKFSPYDYDYTLDPGTEYTVFTMDDKAKDYRFGVMICYEDAMPEIGRKFVLDDKGRKRVDWLVNISNDGWFVRFKNHSAPKKIAVSAELTQHAAVCVFRAVENRVSILRSVNTGISCLIDSSGKIRNDFVAGTLPKKSMNRTGISGWFADIIPVDNRVTFFSRHGQWLDRSCAAVLVLLTVSAVFARQRRDGKKLI